MSEEVKNELVSADEHVNLPITNLTSKQQRFINLYLTGQYTQQKLSQLLDVHINTIQGWLRNQEIKSIITDMQKEQNEQVVVQLKALNNKAIIAMNELLDSPIDAVRLQAAKDILDRGGHKAKQEIKKEVTVTTYEQKLKDIIDSAIDVDYTEVGEEE